jgi:hypothetical protein
MRHRLFDPAQHMIGGFGIVSRNMVNLGFDI